MEVVAIIVLKNRTRAIGVLIDLMGSQIMDATSYYNYRAQRAADFFKLHVVMDEETRVIILVTPSDRYCHDSEAFWSYFFPELGRLARVIGFKTRMYQPTRHTPLIRPIRKLRRGLLLYLVSSLASGDEFRGGALWLLIGGCVVCRGFVDTLMLGGPRGDV